MYLKVTYKHRRNDIIVHVHNVGYVKQNVFRQSYVSKLSFLLAQLERHFNYLLISSLLVNIYFILYF